MGIDNRGLLHANLPYNILMRGKVLQNLALFIFAAACGYAAETVIVNKDFNGREIKVRKGATIQIP